jgi:NADH-quinone oxidoreductase subunit C
MQHPQSTSDLPAEAMESRLQQLREEFAETLLAHTVTEQEMDFTVAPEALADFVGALRRLLLPPQHSFCDACAVERPDSIEAIYRLSLLMEPRRVTIRTHVPRKKPVLPTLSHLYKGALWPERELAEMFGVHIESHPDLRHLLLPNDWQGYPLRKDYEIPRDHPYLASDPLRDDPRQVLNPGEQTTAEPAGNTEP